MDALVDLELLVRSRYPIIAVETWEEDRLGSTLRQIGARLKLHVYEWSVGNPVRRLGLVSGAQADGSQTPLEALRCVVMIDEIEKGFASVSSSESDAGLSRRIFGRLLGWLQDRKAPVFIVATSNDIEALPPEMVRKGRFDEIFFIDLPDVEERTQIFRIHLAKRKRDPETFELAALAAASAGFSGAEIEQAVVSALYTAFSASAELATQHVVEELKATRPLSVTRAEAIANLRAWAAERAVSAR